MSNSLIPLSEAALKRIRALTIKKYRDQEKQFLAEGLRLCEEAKHAADVAAAVVSTGSLEQSRVAELLNDLSAPVYQATEKQFAQLSETQHSQGVLFVVHKPKSRPVGDEPLLLALDALQDPGNVGTLLRTADWFGIQTILIAKGTVDVYNSKVVRGSMGAVFRLNIIVAENLVEDLIGFQQKGYRLIGADLNGDVTLHNIIPKRDVLIVGNEANGLNPKFLDMLDSNVKIPQPGRGESLNAAVAGSIFMYELTR